MVGAAYGYADMGPYDGGQAEFLRIPYADFNLLHLPQGTEHETDFTMLSDIFPTGFHGAVLAEVGIGDRVAVYGAGPVGLMAAHRAFLLRASQVFVVDKVPDRLELAQAYGATAIDFSQGDPIEQIMDATDGNGVDCGVEAVGYQAHDATGEEHPELVLDGLVNVVRAAGAIGVVGVYQGPAHGYRPGAGQAVQPPAAQPDHHWRGKARQDREPRGRTRRGGGRLRQVRLSGGRLHQGAPAPI